MKNKCESATLVDRIVMRQRVIWVDKKLGLRAAGTVVALMLKFQGTPLEVEYFTIRFDKPIFPKSCSSYSKTYEMTCPVSDVKSA